MVAPLWMTLSSTLTLDSSRGWALLLVGESGVVMTLCGRVSLRGASVALALRFRPCSKAEGRSWAPGGIVFLLGLPWGVVVGSMKLLCLVGVVGRAEPSTGLSLPPGKKLDMKLAMATGCWDVGLDYRRGERGCSGLSSCEPERDSRRGGAMRITVEKERLLLLLLLLLRIDQQGTRRPAGYELWPATSSIEVVLWWYGEEIQLQLTMGCMW